MTNKIEVLANALPQEVGNTPVDAAVISSAVNRAYFSGFRSSEGTVFITRDAAYLLVDFRYYEAAKATVKCCEVVLFSSLFDTLSSLIRKHNVNGILLENSKLTLAGAENFEKIFSRSGSAAIKDKTLDKIIEHMRMIKSDYEIEKIRASQEVTEAAFNYILPKISEGVTEKDLALDIEFFMRKQGAESVAFDLIVVSGKNSSLPHGVPSDKRVQRGDFITMDTGAVLDGYHSDMTRTVALGSVTEEQREIYNLVLRAQINGISSIRPGKISADIDKVVRDTISEMGYGKYFGHGTGHGVGLEIHESPSCSINSKTTLRPGMVITVEPGIYLPNKFGVRIEDMIAVTQNGCTNLTNVKKDLLII